MNNRRTRGRRFVALVATLTLSATVAGGGAALGQPPSTDGTYRYQIDGDTLVVSTDGVTIDGLNIDTGAGVAVWAGDNQGNAVFLWASQTGEHDTEPLLVGQLTGPDIDQIENVLADHGDTSPWICVLWANKPVVRTPRTTASARQRCIGDDVVSHRLTGELWERDGLGPFWTKWDSHDTGWSVYRQIGAPLDEYCSNDDWSVWETRASGKVKIRQADHSIRTHSTGRKSSDRSGGDCQG